MKALTRRADLEELFMVLTRNSGPTACASAAGVTHEATRQARHDWKARITAGKTRL